MAQIEVSDKLNTDLEALASQDHRSVNELLEEALTSYMFQRVTEPQLTPAQVERLKLSLQAADRGELISQEEAEAFFDDWEKEIADR
jgi:predicted transcriptional regulator